MDDLIIKKLQNAATPEEVAWLERWRRSCAENDRRYRETVRLWRLARDESPPITGRRPSGRDLIATSRERKRRARFKRWPARRTHIAALAAAALLAGLFIGGFDPDAQVAGVEPLQAAEFVTGPDELASVRLSDGTVVRIGPSTRVRVSDRTDAREVWLDGKAFFAVVSDHPLPFSVRTRSGQALVLGTRFEVDSTEEEFRVTVLEGKVEVAANDQRIEVGAGLMSRTTPDEPSLVLEPSDVRSQLSWMGTFIAFESTPLPQVAEELEHHFGTRVILADSSVAEKRVTAWFGNEPFEEVLKVVCRVAGVHCVVTDSVATIHQ